MPDNYHLPKLTARTLVSSTIFRKTPKGIPVNDVLAIWAHRASFAMYVILANWGLAAAFFNIPTVRDAAPDLFNFAWPLLIAISGGLAAGGVLFYPVLYRLEMYAAGSLIGLIAVYVVLLSAAALAGDAARVPLAVLSLSFEVIPVLRCAIGFWLELRRRRRLAAAQYLAREYLDGTHQL